MPEHFRIGDIVVHLQRKAVKHVHLSVHPPAGRVTLVAPERTRPEVARTYAISKLGWIREQQSRMRAQARESPRRYVERESHQLWGRRYLLSVREKDNKPTIMLSHRRITMMVRPASSAAKRAEILHEWHKSLLHATVPGMIRRWEKRLGVSVTAYFLQRMKTKWGSCNPTAGHIRLNTELVKKPKDLLEYIVVHEMIHLLEPAHTERFKSLLDRHFRHWREARSELNELPLTSEAWRRS